MIYLARPYSHPDSTVRDARYLEACRATAKLVRSGRVVFTPIVLTHPLMQFDLPSDWSYWERFDCEHLRRCTELVVLKLDGWWESRGVQAEIDLALEMDLPIRYLDATWANESTEAIA